MDDAEVHLARGRARTPEIEALVTAAGGRVGLEGVLADLSRRGRPVRRRGAAYAFAWDTEDQRSPRWWPQGITSSADAGSKVAPHERYAGRRVLLTSSYSREVAGARHGARVSVVDLTDPEDPRYEHVLLVAPRQEGGRLAVRPVHAHAGGIVWRGRHLHVAGTTRGIHTFLLDDVVAADATTSAAYGHRFLLPARFAYTAHVAEGGTRFRYSFMSLTRSGGRPGLLAGEYAEQHTATRVVRYELDEEGLPVTDAACRAVPSRLTGVGLRHMQGAVEVDDRLYVTTSAGLLGRGSLWAGSPGRLVRHRWVLPAGPEDLCHEPSPEWLWTVTEYPRRRVVLALDRRRFSRS